MNIYSQNKIAAKMRQVVLAIHEPCHTSYYQQSLALQPDTTEPIRPSL